MRSRQSDLSAILKMGLTPLSGDIPGLVEIKNLWSNGHALYPIPAESTTKIDDAIPFTRGTEDYYVNSGNVYKTSSGTPMYAGADVTGTLSFVDLIKVVWIQTASKTFFIDADGIYNVNPSGNSIPLCNSLIGFNGQIIAGGILDSTNSLDEGFIAWSDIAFDSFTIDKQNTAGFVHPNIGKVKLLLPMTQSVLALGTSGAHLMMYADQLFGHKSLRIPLAHSRMIGAANNQTAIYLSKFNTLVAVDAQGTATDLGFEWFAKDVVSIKYLKGRNWFVFTTSSTSYIWNGQCMFSFGYKVFGEFTETLCVPTTFEQNSCSFRTSFFDSTDAGLKYLQEVYLDDGSSTTGEVIIYGDDLSKTQGYKQLNSLKSSKYPLAGSKFSIGYSNASSSGIAIKGLKIEACKVDKRFGAGYTPGYTPRVNGDIL